jgi:sulfur-oxidizing protein SoxX
MRKAKYMIAAGTILLSATATNTISLNKSIANPVTPDKVKIVEGEIKSPLTSKAGDPKKGRKWFANRKFGNCLACHANKDMTAEQFHGEIGPSMDEVALRYSPSQLRAILVDARSVFGKQTIMPAFYTVDTGKRIAKKFKGKTILSGQQVEDIIAYLQTLKK